MATVGIKHHVPDWIKLSFVFFDRVPGCQKLQILQITAIKHSVPDWVKLSFVIFDIRAL